MSRILAKQVGELLLQHNLLLVTAESCTGGGVAQEVTAIAGSSQWFDRGFVTYTNLSKQEMLDVDPLIIATHGAVSEQTVRSMACGALVNSYAQIAVSISGIAGPGGGSDDKPVGTIWFAWAFADGKVDTQKSQFDGDRNQVRQQAVEQALQGIIDRLTEYAG